MQDLSYDNRDYIVEFNHLKINVQVYTFENVYGMNQEDMKETTTGNHKITIANSLSWAGNTEIANGQIQLDLEREDKNTKIRIKAEADKVIRCTKVKILNVPMGEIVSLRETEAMKIPKEGIVLHYPSGWRELDTPLVILKTDSGDLLYFRSLDTKVREKRVTFLNRGDHLEVEMIYEECADQMGHKVQVPEWEVGTTDSMEEIYQIHMKSLVDSYQLEKWEDRKDVPDWMHEISLVASIHGQHWSGYIFNDYQMILDKIKWLTQYVEPKKILVYLPGWEGRYYWKYGDYCPDERMGGAEGFKNMVQEAKKLGVHIMPMFGINIVNKQIDSYEEWANTSLLRSPSCSTTSDSGSVDWDGSRHYDHNFGMNLNPGAPRWQNRLVNQIREMIHEYGFDAVFLDIAAVWKNDPNYYLYDGIKTMVNRIRDGKENLLVAGEAWYDGLSAIFPVFQAGHTDGVHNWHDRPYETSFTEYNRQFGHLCLGDLGRGSTGVHELGYNMEQTVPYRKGIIPTLTIVEDTFEKGLDKVEEVLKQANQYYDDFIKEVH